jgi:hypothetical protein
LIIFIGNAHSVILVNSIDDTTEPSHQLNLMRLPKSVIPYEALEEKETVGKGPIGDFHRCIWKGQVITMKVLINQKLEESDLLTLQARASVLS